MTYHAGQRVALVYTNDPHTSLRPGTEGTVQTWKPEKGRLSVQWDDGSGLAMFPDEGDIVRVLPDQEKTEKP